LGLNSIYFHAKTTLFGDYFLAYFGLWSIIYSNRMCFIFSWTMNVMSFSPFLKFVHILWISRIIWKLIHLKLQYVMSNCHEWHDSSMVYFRFRQVNIPHTSIGYVYSFTF
jgi:hypothetical protein